MKCPPLSLKCGPEWENLGVRRRHCEPRAEFPWTWTTRACPRQDVAASPAVDRRSPPIHRRPGWTDRPGRAPAVPLSTGARDPRPIEKHAARESGRWRWSASRRSFVAMLDRIAKVARYRESVLITGESGSGKEHVAQAISLLEPRQGSALRLRELPAISGGQSHGQRAVRPRQGQLHRGGFRPRRCLRAGAHRHPLPRRDRRSSGKRPGDAAADARDRRIQAGRRQRRQARRRPRRRRDEPPAQRDDGVGRVSPRPVLPAPALSRDGATAAPARGRLAAHRRVLPRCGSACGTACGSGCRRLPNDVWRTAHGRATCVSSSPWWVRDTRWPTRPRSTSTTSPHSSTATRSRPTAAARRTPRRSRRCPVRVSPPLRGQCRVLADRSGTPCTGAFMDRDLNRSQVRAFISRGLEATAGATAISSSCSACPRRTISASWTSFVIRISSPIAAATASCRNASSTAAQWSGSSIGRVPHPRPPCASSAESGDRRLACDWLLRSARDVKPGVHERSRNTDRRG